MPKRYHTPDVASLGLAESLTAGCCRGVFFEPRSPILRTTVSVLDL
jgi:hypothetical protein